MCKVDINKILEETKDLTKKVTSPKILPIDIDALLDQNKINILKRKCVSK